MAWVTVPNSDSMWEYENTATSSDTYSDSAAGANSTISGGIRTYTKPGTSDTVTVYARTRIRGEINLAPNSEDFTAWLTNNGVTRTPNATIAPDDSLTGTSIIEVANAQAHNVFFNTLIVTSGLKYTFSIYAKYNGRPMQILTGGAFGFQTYANFNLQTGTLGTKGTSVTGHKIENVGNGWYRCSMTTSNASTNATNGGFSFNLIETDSATRGQAWTGDGVSGIFVWGAMASESEYIRRYIKTTGSDSTTIERGELSKTYYDNQ